MQVYPCLYLEFHVLISKDVELIYSISIMSSCLAKGIELISLLWFISMPSININSLYWVLEFCKFMVIFWYKFSVGTIWWDVLSVEPYTKILSVGIKC